jgi:phosphatidylserine/phosphatidylglycerophosphate/cardiolipin synthase-like enzyme
VALVPLADGNDALGARLGMIEEAERSIDIKTFLIKPDIDAARQNGAADRPLTMHTKVVVVDGRMLFVGSFNVDPRSIRQNTEIGMTIESPRLARGILERIEAVAPDYPFEVVAGPNGAPLWHYHGAGRRETFGDEQLASSLIT